MGGLPSHLPPPQAAQQQSATSAGAAPSPLSTLVSRPSVAAGTMVSTICPASSFAVNNSSMRGGYGGAGGRYASPSSPRGTGHTGGAPPLGFPSGAREGVTMQQVLGSTRVHGQRALCAWLWCGRAGGTAVCGEDLVRGGEEHSRFGHEEGATHHRPEGLRVVLSNGASSAWACQPHRVQ